MSRLEELIAELCPDGVEYRPIGELAKYEQPSKYIVKSTDYNNEYKIPVLTAGQSFILGYTNETEGIYPASESDPVIIFDDFTGAFKWVDFQFKVKSSAMKMLTANESITSLRYIFHLMGWLNYMSNEHKRLWIGTYSQFSVPVPPLEVQREIVRVLDHFTLLSALLSAELKARKQQYAYYREILLSNEDYKSQRTLGELCNISAGGDAPKGTMSKEKTEEYMIPIISNGIGDNALYGYTNISKISVPAVTVAARGTIGYAEYRNYPYFPIIRLLSVIPKDQKTLNTKFLYYCLQGKQYKVPTSGIPQLTAPMLKSESIPVPSLDNQERVVRILDSFDTICSNLNNGLPAEIEARQKQYEYYRDKLLTFKELA